MSGEFGGKVVVITGAGSGIGRAAALAFARLGARVVAANRRVADGESLVATHGGKELYFSTYKTRCSDREHCPSLSAACEAPSASGVVNHFIVSSEPLQGENVWLPLAQGDIVGVDSRMQISKSHLDRTALPVA